MFRCVFPSDFLTSNVAARLCICSRECSSSVLFIHVEIETTNALVSAAVAVRSLMRR